MNKPEEIRKLTTEFLSILLDKNLAEDFYKVSIKMMPNNEIVKEIRILKSDETN